MSKSAQALIMELRSAKLPWGWNWIEQQASNQTPDRLATSGNPKLASVNVRPTSSGSRRTSLAFEPSLDEPTPRYSRSPLGIRSAKGPKPASVDGSPWHRHHRVVAATPLRDDESMTSCPPLASPNYMVPTISAKAKVRSQVSPSAKSQGLEPTKRRLSFASAKSPFSSLSWGKGSIFTSKEANSRGPLGLNMGMHSPGRLSIDSTMSLPVGVGRKPFRWLCVSVLIYFLSFFFLPADLRWTQVNFLRCSLIRTSLYVFLEHALTTHLGLAQGIRASELCVGPNIEAGDFDQCRYSKSGFCEITMFENNLWLVLIIIFFTKNSVDLWCMCCCNDWWIMQSWTLDLKLWFCLSLYIG